MVTADVREFIINLPSWDELGGTAEACYIANQENTHRTYFREKIDAVFLALLLLLIKEAYLKTEAYIRS